nr:glycosyltransferase [Chthoniobacterales bacterium]
ADLSLVLAGPDQVGWKTELLSLAERLKIQSSVVFTGMIDGEVKRGALAAAEAFVLPSHQENFGLSVVEALAAGLPVLISNCVNIWREVEADQAGFVESDDVPGTTRLIKRWLDMPDEERETMRTRANQCFAARFEIGRAADSLLRVLEETHPAK